jgi:hypothetical protein
MTQIIKKHFLLTRLIAVFGCMQGPVTPPFSHNRHDRYELHFGPARRYNRSRISIKLKTDTSGKRRGCRHVQDCSWTFCLLLIWAFNCSFFCPADKQVSHTKLAGFTNAKLAGFTNTPA